MVQACVFSFDAQVRARVKLAAGWGLLAVEMEERRKGEEEDGR